MADEFAEHLLRSSLAHMCKQQGWHTATQSSLSVFASIARHYVHNLGTLTRNYSTFGGREEPNLDDLGQAMSELGLVLEDLQNFWSETDSSSGAPQVCNFPHSVTHLLNPTDTTSDTERPDHIPVYLPPLKEEIPVVPETSAQETVTVTETSGETSKADDLFDEAAAAPAPSAPNFPFISVSIDDLPEPKFSSWGFQRVNIAAPKNISDETNTSAEAKSAENSEKKSPDNFAILENSDDFVFASKHNKSSEEPKHRKLPKTESPPPKPKESKNPNHSIKIAIPRPELESDKAADVTLDDTTFIPSLGASTPVVKTKDISLLTTNAPNPKDKKTHLDPKLNCKQKLFEKNGGMYKHSDQTTTIEEISGYVPESKVKEECLSPVRPKTPDITANSDSDTDVFNNDYGFDDSSSEAFESKIAITIPKPPSPTISPIPQKIDNHNVIAENHEIPNHPSKKRRKLDKPLAQKNHEDHENSLLKNRIDLLNTDLTGKPKSECKHINVNNLSEKSNHKKHKHESNHLSSKRSEKNDNHNKTKIKHDKSSKVDGDLKRKKHRKSKKKEQRHSNEPKKSHKTQNLFEDGIITHNDITTNFVSTQPSSEPLKVSLSALPTKKPISKPLASKIESLTKEPKKPQEVKSSVPTSRKQSSLATNNHVIEPMKHSPSIKIEPPKAESTERSLQPLKLSLKKPLPVKSSTVLDIRTSNDESSLSSDSSLDGFEDLLPKPKKDNSKQSRRMVKTKAELKNHSMKSPLRAVTTTKELKTDKKSKAYIPKIKINKGPPRDVNSPPPKTSIKKLKLSSPTPPVDANVSTISAISNQSLVIDESYMSNKSVSEEKVEKFVPRIKIKLGQNTDDLSFISSPKESINEPPASPIPPKGPNLTIKFNDNNFYVPSSSTSEVKKNVPPPIVKKKGGKVKKEKRVEKKKTVISTKTAEPPPPSLDTSDSIHDDIYMSSQSLESTVVSETVSLTTPIQPEAVPAVQVWYCPACSLPDDGSPMVGCDKCDGWFHWPCVNMTAPPPDDQDWYCPSCVKKTQRAKKKKKKH